MSKSGDKIINSLEDTNYPEREIPVEKFSDVVADVKININKAVESMNVPPDLKRKVDELIKDFLGQISEIEQIPAEPDKIEVKEKKEGTSVDELVDNFNHLLDTKLAELEPKSYEVDMLKSAIETWKEAVVGVLSSDKTKQEKINDLRLIFRNKFPRSSSAPLDELEKSEIKILSKKELKDLSDEELAVVRNMSFVLEENKDSETEGYFHRIWNEIEDRQKIKENIEQLKSLINELDRAYTGKESKREVLNKAGEVFTSLGLTTRYGSAVLSESKNPEDLLLNNDTIQQAVADAESKIYELESKIYKGEGSYKAPEPYEYRESIKFSEVTNWQELYDAINKLGYLTDSTQTYTAEALIEIIDKVRADELDIKEITSEKGLREKVQELQSQEKEAQEKVIEPDLGPVIEPDTTKERPEGYWEHDVKINNEDVIIEGDDENGVVIIRDNYTYESINTDSVLKKNWEKRLKKLYKGEDISLLEATQEELEDLAGDIYIKSTILQSHEDNIKELKFGQVQAISRSMREDIDSLQNKYGELFNKKFIKPYLPKKKSLLSKVKGSLSKMSGKFFKRKKKEDQYTEEISSVDDIGPIEEIETAAKPEFGEESDSAKIESPAEAHAILARNEESEASRAQPVKEVKDSTQEEQLGVGIVHDAKEPIEGERTLDSGGDQKSTFEIPKFLRGVEQSPTQGQPIVKYSEDSTEALQATITEPINEVETPSLEVVEESTNSETVRKDGVEEGSTTGVPVVEEQPVVESKRESLSLGLEDIENKIKGIISSKFEVEFTEESNKNNVLEISEISNGLRLKTTLCLGGLAGDVKIIADIMNMESTIHLVNTEITARIFTKLKIKKGLPEVVPKIKEHFEQEKKKSVSSMRIEGPNLIVEFEE